MSAGVAASVLAAMLISAQAGASVGDPVVSRHIADPGASLAFWTPERMSAATPVPMTDVDPAGLAGSSLVSVGTPVKFDGSPPAGSASRFSSRSQSTNSEVFEGGRIIPFKRFEIDEPTQAPYVTHGQVFMRTASGVPLACSGTVVQSENKSVVWTAAHCIYSFGEYRRNFVFVPGYKDGPSHHGTWAATEVLIPSEYEANENLDHDFGALVLAPNEEGLLVGDAVGMRGIAFNQSPAEAFQSFGYPAAPQHLFNGERMISCQSQGSGRVYGGAISMGCDMQEGSSGGGWIMRGGYLASNQSGGSPGTYLDIAWGPYLGSSAKKLYDEARGGSGPVPQPTPTAPTGNPTTHTMKVNLKLAETLMPDGQTMLVARGRVSATDGYLACNHLTPVKILKFRKSNRTYYPVGTLAFANVDGRYAVVLPDKPGRYTASTEESPYDLSNNCAKDYSDPVRHLH